MNILILGAGTVGCSLSSLLVLENHDVTVVDINQNVLQKLQDRLDIKTVCGHASHPRVLEEAGITLMDMIIAVTQNDDTNILACEVASCYQKTVKKIARVRSREYLSYSDLFNNKQINCLSVDELISPEELVTNYIMDLIEHPGALQVVDFANNKVRLVSVLAADNAHLVGQKIKDFKNKLPKKVVTRIVAIYRKDAAIMPTGEDIIKTNDEVFFLTKSKDTQRIMYELNNRKVLVNKLMLAGAGNIGLSLAKMLENKYKVSLVENKIDRAAYAAENLKKSLVIYGDVSDKELLKDEDIDEVDLFVAVTNSDEANIMSSMLAKKLGSHRAVSVVNNISYVDLIDQHSIDVVISADRITTSRLMHLTREGDTVKAMNIHGGKAEALEIVIHGSENSSMIIGKTIGEVNWPRSITVGCIIREDGEVLIAHRNVEIIAGDHMIIFIANKQALPELNRIINPKTKKNKLS